MTLNPAETIDDASPASPTHPSTPRRLWIVWKVVTCACVAAALVHPTASLLSRHHWIADLITHFQGPALVLTVLALALTSLGRRSRWLALPLVALAAFQLAPLARYTGANPVVPDPRSPERFRIVLANVLYNNTAHEAFLALVRAEKPDAVGIVEFDTPWIEAMAPLHDEFPYRSEYPAGPSGLALWFRKPPRTLEQADWWLTGRNPVLHATFDFAGKVRHLWLVHPMSPVHRVRWETGNPEMAKIAERVRATRGSRIVMGDMNSTDGSAYFRDFLRTTGLRDSRLGFGLQGSWPRFSPYRIAIDHVFLSDDLAVVDRRLGADTGSDHLPVVVDLAPAAATNRATNSAQSSVDGTALR